MNRTYEAMLLLDNREVRKGWQALKEQVNGVFTKHGATIKSSRRWDERRLAYAIGRQLRGTYLLNYVEADTQALTAIRRDLEYADSVLRYLVLACDEIPQDAFNPEDAFDETQVRVETEGSPAPAAVAVEDDATDDADDAPSVDTSSDDDDDDSDDSDDEEDDDD